MSDAGGRTVKADVLKHKSKRGNDSRSESKSAEVDTAAHGRDRADSTRFDQLEGMKSGARSSSSAPARGDALSQAPGSSIDADAATALAILGARPM